jgi:transcriptional regulator with XRE-family HTH domain
MNLDRRVRREIRAELAERGMTRAELATLIGCAPSRVSRLLGGDTAMRLQDADAIADALGMRWHGVDGLRLEHNNT